MALLGDVFNLFDAVFNIDEFGYWEHGNYVLIQNRPLEQIARENNISHDELRQKKRSWEKRLFEARSNRSRSGLDDKSLTSWNALMCKGFGDAYFAFGEKQYLDSAIAIGNFITKNLWQPDGNLMRTWKDGRASINGYLEDYAHTANAFISLYQATCNESWLANARQLCDYCFLHFHDPESGYFRFTSTLDKKLVAPHFELEDNVIPASNSVMASVLVKLAAIYGNAHYQDTAAKMVSNVIPTADYPSAFANWFDVLLDLSPGAAQLVICGKGARAKAAEAMQHYIPDVFVAGCETESALPLFKDRCIDGRLIYYVCRDKACSLPMDNLETALSTLKNNNE